MKERVTMRMSVAGSVIVTGGLALLIPLLPAAYAQTTAPGSGGVPTRIDNIYNGEAHQPTAGGVARREDNAGVEASQSRQSKVQDELDRMGQQLEQKARQDGASAPPPLKPPNGK